MARDDDGLDGEGLAGAAASPVQDEDEDYRILAIELERQARRPGRSILERMESLLRLAKAMRRAGILSGVEATYLVSAPIERIAEERLMAGCSPAYESAARRLRALEVQHGLGPDELWDEGEGPEEAQALSRRLAAIRREIVVATFEEYGEPELGGLYRLDEDAFIRLRRAGRQEVQAVNRAAGRRPNG